MRRLALVLIALLASCVITPNPSQEIETRWSKMIKGKSYPAYPYKKTDILKNEFDFRTEDQNYWIQYYLNAGYTIYDVPAEGGFTYLSAKGAGKYLCLWKTTSPKVLDTAVTGTATAGAATTITLAAGASGVDDYYKGCVIELTAGTGSGQFNVITAYNGTSKVATVKTWGTNPNNTSVYKIGAHDRIEAGDISIHTDVVIIGAKINAFYNIEPDTFNTTGKFSQIPYFQLNFYSAGDTDASHKLTLKYCFHYFFTTSTYKLTNVTYDHNYNYNFGYSTSRDFGLRNSTLISNYFDFSNSVNGYIGGDEEVSYNYFNDTGSFFEVYTQSGNFLSNYATENHRISLNGAFTTANNSGNYFDSFDPTSGFSSTYLMVVYCSAKGNYAGSLNKSIIYKVVKDYNPITYKTAQGYAMLKVDSTIDFTTFKKLQGDFGVEYVQNNSIASNPIRNYYTLTFLQGYTVDDALKKFSKDLYYFCVQRDDFEEVFIPAGVAKKVLNLGLYDNDGTTPFSYDNDENFLILAKDASNNYAVFIWFNNALYRTAISDVFDGVTYTIEHCFQLWEIDSMNGVKQEISSDSVTNLPMSGSIRFNNIDNEIVIR